MRSRPRCRTATALDETTAILDRGSPADDCNAPRTTQTLLSARRTLRPMQSPSLPGKIGYLTPHARQKTATRLRIRAERMPWIHSQSMALFISIPAQLHPHPPKAVKRQSTSRSRTDQPLRFRGQGWVSPYKKQGIKSNIASEGLHTSHLYLRQTTPTSNAKCSSPNHNKNGSSNI